MSERKVLTKYYPPDFDPSALTRRRTGPKPSGPKVQTVRVAAPFSMRCTTCGEYIYKGRKFNSRKETPLDERYLGIQIYRFYIRCTRCSAEITYKTDPKNNDYAMERGAKRNTEPWRQKEFENETDEERLDRLMKERKMEEEEEEKVAKGGRARGGTGGSGDGEKNAMRDLEDKTAEANREMAVADALDEIRVRAAMRERKAKDGAVDGMGDVMKEEGLTQEQKAVLERQDREDEEYARKAFAAARSRQNAGVPSGVMMDTLVEEDEAREEDRLKIPETFGGITTKPQKRRGDAMSGMPALKLLKRDNAATTKTTTTATPIAAAARPAAAAIPAKAPVKKAAGPLVAYGSDSDSE